MLYRLLKIPARIAFYLYCRRIRINNRDVLKKKGPLLIAASHPNAFLDAIILATLFKQPVYSLTRGDVFANKFYSKVLHSLKMLPVYRLKEGADNIERNYSTFEACIDIFQKGGIVLIFSEGETINDWRLRPLKKGTARLALTAWQKGIPLEVLPVGINYNSFRSFGKDIILNFGEVIKETQISNEGFEGLAINELNGLLYKRLNELVYAWSEIQFKRPSSAEKTLLFIPAVLGYILHYPLFFLVDLLIKKKDDDMYDSIVIGLLFAAYPFYLFLMFGVILMFANAIYGVFLTLAIPVIGWAYLQLKTVKK